MRNHNVRKKLKRNIIVLAGSVPVFFLAGVLCVSHNSTVSTIGLIFGGIGTVVYHITVTKLAGILATEFPDNDQ